MRHSFASQLVMKGVSLKVVQELLGHSDIRTTMRYAHLSQEAKQEAVLTLDEPSGTKACPKYAPLRDAESKSTEISLS